MGEEKEILPGWVSYQVKYTWSEVPDFVIPVCEDVTVGVFPWARLPKCTPECYTNLYGDTHHISSCEKFVIRYADFLTLSDIKSAIGKLKNESPNPWFHDEKETETKTETTNYPGASSAAEFMHDTVSAAL